ncbi:MAG: alpha-L-fucosidase [Caldilineaceae bacterium]|nr:alpha-L-fucosidase [Caldilineaceae bacterium]
MVAQVSKAGLEWFQDVRFGMFVHWGLYSLIGKQEWVMHTDRIPVPEYEKLVSQFNPTRFNASEWVAVAADAGQKYMVITSRHHDGFSMYDTALSDYKVTNTPFKRDPIRELADACARRGDIKLGFYVSLLDWHHPAYRFRAERGLAWDDYLAFLHGQVRELCTQFGELACLWFDGDWPRHPIDDSNRYFLPGGSFEYERLYDMIHRLQPAAVIQNNRHEQPLPGEDIQGFEQDLPGENTTGFNATTIYDLPIEVCMTINDHWGYSKADRNTKSARRLVHVLARSASAGGNLLLNVGPTPEGEILPLHAQRLRGVGEWLARHGEAIYGTRKGVIPPTHETVSTRRGDVHYVHLLDDVSDCVVLTGVPQTVTQARLLATGEPLELERAGVNFFVARGQDRTTIYLPPAIRDRDDTVVVLS